MTYQIQEGVSFESGAVSISKNSVNFCFAAAEYKTLFLCLYDLSGKQLLRVDLAKYHAFGCVYSVLIQPLDSHAFYYTIEKDGKICIDPYVKNCRRLRKWGEPVRKGHIDPAMVYDRVYDWEGDRPLRLDTNDLIAYELHVRGFTKHSSAKVTHRGTYLGLIERLPYIRELGVTQIVLMPAYFFYEFDEESRLIYTEAPGDSASGQETGEKMNYWGFKNACYFMPKPEYAASDDFVREFKDMVKAFHRAGIEIVMRFYFPKEVNRNRIIPCLQHWVKEYHIDGFLLMGEALPIGLIVTDDILYDTRIYYQYFDRNDSFFSAGALKRNLCLAVCNRDYMNTARRFVKSDEDMLNAFIYAQSDNPADIRRINYVTTYEGFTLNDLVSYDYKHNENNGEENRDGENYNYSWNCGVEGVSRKKQINELRLKQMKNILVMLFMARGIPMLPAGDECMNSQDGNNNPYCQDNPVSWVNWRDTALPKELHAFVRELIAFRKAHPIVHMCHEPKLMDSLSCGYPDLSYHAEQAWYPKLANHIRHIGMLYCGKYAKREDGSDDDFIYIAYNMHWETHSFALVKLPKGLSWEAVLCTDKLTLEEINRALAENSDFAEVPPRSVMILKSTRRGKL
ncbi:MAG: hypothetical protein K6G83_15715 [Lachnospiraceae bacterium]|nr:hypothetical protein [Lachnospiraceae bacterium]